MVNSILSRRGFLRVSPVVGGALYGLSTALPLSATPRQVGRSEKEGEVLEMPTSAYHKRVANVQAELAKRQVDALVITAIAGLDLRYLAKESTGILVVPAAGEPTLILSDPPAPRPRIQDTWITDVRWGRGWEPMLDQCADRLKELHSTRGKIAIGGDGGWAARIKLASTLPDAHFEEGNRIQDQQRLIKDEYEIKFMRRAAAIADAEIRAAQLATRPGRRVYEIVAETQRAALMRGAAIRESVDLTGFSSSEVPRLLGGTSRTHPLGVGEAFLFEPIPYYGHYNVETPVTFALGKVSTAQKELAELCFQSFQAAVAELKPDVPVLNAVKAARAVVNPKGFPDNTNGTGHFIGIANVERPPIEDDHGAILKPGMTVSIHGNLVAAGKARAITGCCFLITEKGKEALTSIKLTPMFQL